jgi:hypothetical protein
LTLKVRCRVVVAAVAGTLLMFPAAKLSAQVAATLETRATAKEVRLGQTIAGAQHYTTPLARCHIAPDNPAQPLMTWPWNAFLCGMNSQGWVWLVSISKLSPANYMVMAKYLPTFTVIGDQTISEGTKAKFYGPGGQYITITVTKASGDAKKWRDLKVWVDVVGVYRTN